MARRSFASVAAEARRACRTGAAAHVRAQAEAMRAGQLAGRNWPPEVRGDFARVLSAIADDVEAGMGDEA